MRRITIPADDVQHVRRMLAGARSKPVLNRISGLLDAAPAGDITLELQEEECRAAARWISGHRIIGKMCDHFWRSPTVNEPTAKPSPTRHIIPLAPDEREEILAKLALRSSLSLAAGEAGAIITGTKAGEDSLHTIVLTEAQREAVHDILLRTPLIIPHADKMLVEAFAPSELDMRRIKQAIIAADPDGELCRAGPHWIPDMTRPARPGRAALIADYLPYGLEEIFNRGHYSVRGGGKRVQRERVRRREKAFAIIAEAKLGSIRKQGSRVYIGFIESMWQPPIHRRTPSTRAPALKPCEDDAIAAFGA